MPKPTLKSLHARTDELSRICNILQTRADRLAPVLSLSLGTRPAFPKPVLIVRLQNLAPVILPIRQAAYRSFLTAGLSEEG